MVFCSLAKTSRTQKKNNKKKKKSDPWATSGLSTHKPKNQKKQKNKKTKNQETKKTKKTKNKKKKKKTRLHTPRGGGQMQSVGSCLFVFFGFFGFLVFCFFVFLVFWFFGFLLFWFFGFLVCVWIAIADVPSRGCQALSVVALEARSIHYSTALFAIT